MTIFSRVKFSTFYHLSHAHKSWQKITMNGQRMPPSRSNPIIKTLDSGLFHALFTQELNELIQIFKKHNYQLRIAGGAVRDILMDIKPKDLDFATDATPEKMKEIFGKENIRLINNRGEKHGTITPRINNENFEITTLRIDTHTDGRHAKVEFTNDWKLDALRRDLTINSMFLDFEGKIYDYFFGYDDLQIKRIAFVGNPMHRIKEDYIRILRYFRFYGRLAKEPDCHDESTIIAIRENICGLGKISGERIWSEWSKILSGNYAKELMLKMLECGIAEYVGLPENLNVEQFVTIYDNAKKNNVSLQPITLLTIMLRNQDEIFQVHKRLKLSAYERDLALFLIRYWEDKPTEDLMKYYTRIIIHWIGNVTHIKNYICELLKCKGRFLLAENIEKMVIPRFPVSGKEIIEQVTNEIMVGIIIRKLKDIWLDKDFEVDAEQLLKEVPRIIKEFDNKNREQGISCTK